jgi:predicted component of type VI protein secretion system
MPTPRRSFDNCANPARQQRDDTPAAAELRLEVLTQRCKWHGRTIVVTRSPFLIGSARACHLRAPTSRLSGFHCALIVRGGRRWVRDLGSDEGTFLNGERVSADSALRDGDRLKVGTLELGIRLDAHRMKPAPPPIAQESARFMDDEEAAALLLAELNSEDKPRGVKVGTDTYMVSAESTAVPDD